MQQSHQLRIFRKGYSYISVKSQYTLSMIHLTTLAIASNPTCSVGRGSKGLVTWGPENPGDPPTSAPKNLGFSRSKTRVWPFGSGLKLHHTDPCPAIYIRCMLQDSQYQLHLIFILCTGQWLTLLDFLTSNTASACNPVDLNSVHDKDRVQNAKNGSLLNDDGCCWSPFLTSVKVQQSQEVWRLSLLLLPET